VYRISLQAQGDQRDQQEKTSRLRRRFPGASIWKDAGALPQRFEEGTGAALVRGGGDHVEDTPAGMKLQVGAGDAGDDPMRSGNGLVGELEVRKGEGAPGEETRQSVGMGQRAKGGYGGRVDKVDGSEERRIPPGGAAGLLRGSAKARKRLPVGRTIMRRSESTREEGR